MTENNAAQAIQEGERNSAADQYFKARAWVMDTNDNRRIFEAGFDRAYVLLSKLRAEGVQAGDERSAFGSLQQEASKMASDWAANMRVSVGPPTEDEIDAYEEGYLACAISRRPASLASAPVAEPKRAPADDGICWTSKEIQRRQKEEDDARAAYYAARASAPVAGEAPTDREIGALWAATPNPGRVIAFARALLSKYAAPQASEAVRSERLERANKLPEVECPRCELKVISSCGSKGCPTNDGYADLCQTQADKDGGDCAKGAGDGQQKYWLCCGSKDPNHPNRRAPDCFNTDRARWGTADRHSAAQKQGDSDA